MIDAAIRTIPDLETTREGITVVRRVAHNLGNLTAGEANPLFVDNMPLKGRALALHKARFKGAILAFCRFFEPLGWPIKEAQEKIGEVAGGLSQTAVEHIERRARVSLEGTERPRNPSEEYRALEIGYHEARSRLNVYRPKSGDTVRDPAKIIRRVYKNMFVNKK